MTVRDTGNKETHVAIIMDGNGRWGQDKEGSRTEGHRKGASTVRMIVRHACQIGLQYLTLYAFSTENWKRPWYEIFAIMALLETFATQEIDAMVENNIRVQFIGRRDKIPRALVEAMILMEHRTSECTGMLLQVAIDYGGRDELVRAFNQLRKLERDVTEADVEVALDTYPIPDPDLVIRTGGDKRMSNLLLWQAAYSEIHFTDTLWPDFSTKEFDTILLAFKGIERRFGGILKLAASE